ncbi:MAG: hypothetical protein NWE96_02385 [Candidatus Bathyarchaeota archaeon]|nr:hypothetical protein [Candidatus Bathyarchaeota archaeon]
MEWQIIGYAITAFSGAVFALVLTEVLKWLKRPKLSMNLDFSALTEFRDQNTGDIQKKSDYRFLTWAKRQQHTVKPKLNH